LIGHLVANFLFRVVNRLIRRFSALKMKMQHAPPASTTKTRIADSPAIKILGLQPSTANKPYKNASAKSDEISVASSN
jgi:hypothetical protein